MPPAATKRLGVVGAGTMGAGIAETAIRHGIPTVLFDDDERALASAESRLANGLLSLTREIEALAGCDAVIEAISERLEAKRGLFSQLGEMCPAPALLATNTSSLRVSSLATSVSDPGRLVGMHSSTPCPACAWSRSCPVPRARRPRSRGLDCSARHSART